MGQSRPLFVYFCYFHDTISIIQFEKSIDGVLGIRTRGRRMVGPDKTTELWRPPIIKLPLLCMFFLFAVSKKSIGRSVLQAMFITLITLKLMIKLTQTVLKANLVNQSGGSVIEDLLTGNKLQTISINKHLAQSVFLNEDLISATFAKKITFFGTILCDWEILLVEMAKY